MQLDSLLLARLAREAESLLRGGTVRECHALPTEPGLAVQVATPQGRHALGIFLQPELSRWHLISTMPPRVESAETHLSKVARQKLGGTQLHALEVPAGERVLIVHFVRRDFTGQSEAYRLVAELMGPRSNLVLCDGSGVILAAWRVAHAYENEFREVRSGKPYVPPPPTGQAPFATLSRDDWERFLAHQDPARKLASTLLSAFRGMTPGIIAELCARLELRPGMRVEQFPHERLDEWARVVQVLGEAIEAGSALPPWDRWIDPGLRGLALHRAVEGLYARWESEARATRRAQQWAAALAHRAADLQRLREHLESEQARHAENLASRATADLLFASLHLFPSAPLGYERTYTVPDIFDDPEHPPGVDITVPADRSGRQLAQEMHARASRAQRGLEEVARRLLRLEAEAERLAQRSGEWQAQVGLDAVAWEVLLKRVRSGADQAAIMRAPAKKGQLGEAERSALLPIALKGSNIHVYRLPEDLLCFVGGNAVANEALWRYGEGEQLWLHAKGVPGSHVLIPTPQRYVPDAALLAAARLAVTHSSVSQGTKIPVDYTQVRHLKKPPGTAPGLVTYTRERTLLTDPYSETELKRMRL